MSQWTHVAGIIRVDGIDQPKNAPLFLGHQTKDWLEREGMSFEESNQHWDDAQNSGIPMGSEGSLKWKWSTEGRESSMYKGNYYIWGDLRDFNDPKIILEWLSKKVKELDNIGYFLRQLSVNIWVEGEEPYTICDINDTGELQMIQLTNATKVLFGEK